MEIVHVVGLYPPHLGGQEAVVEQLGRRLADDHQVTVYTSDLGARSAPPVERHAGAGGRISVVRLRAVLAANVPVIPGLLLRLLRHRPKPDLLHVHTGQALLLETVALAARLRGIRYLAHQHLVLRPSTRVGRWLLPAYQRLLYAPVLRRADRVICLTGAMRDEVAATYRVDRSRIAVVPNGVDLVPPVPRQRDSGELLFVGRLAPQKNVDALLDAAAELRAGGRPARIRVVGDGELRPHLERRASALGLTDVVFEGRRERADIAAAYARASAVVMPSTHEGMPLVLLEAMAAGAPVVASPLPEIVEVGGRAVVTADPAQPRMFAAVLAAVLDDADLRARLSAASTARAREYSWTVVVPALVELYRGVLRG